MPSHLADQFTPGEMAVMRIIADEHRDRGGCARSIGEIAARAGVCPRTVQNALRHAERIQRDQDRLRANLQAVQDAGLRATWLARMREQEQEMESVRQQRDDGLRALADAERRTTEVLEALRK